MPDTLPPEPVLAVRPGLSMTDPHGGREGLVGSCHLQALGSFCRNVLATASPHSAGAAASSSKDGLRCHLTDASASWGGPASSECHHCGPFLPRRVGLPGLTQLLTRGAGPLWVSRWLPPQAGSGKGRVRGPSPVHRCHAPTTTIILHPSASLQSACTGLERPPWREGRGGAWGGPEGGDRQADA